MAKAAGKTSGPGAGAGAGAGAEANAKLRATPGSGAGNKAARAKPLAAGKTTGEAILAAASEAWVCCDAPGCGKWRRVPGDVADAVGVGGRWVCADAPDPRFSSCNAPQELSDDEIDRRIDLAAGRPALGGLTTNAAGAEAAAATNPKTKPGGGNSGGRAPCESARAGGGRGTETAPRKRPRLEPSPRRGSALSNPKRKGMTVSQEELAAMGVATASKKMKKSAEGAVRKTAGSDVPGGEKRVGGARRVCETSEGVVFGCPKCRHAPRGCRRCNPRRFQ